MSTRWANRPTPGVLASTTYNPAGNATPTTTSTTYVDVDATNILVSFRAPPSGKVRVTTSLYARNNTGGQVVKFNLREGSSDLTGTGQSVTDASTGARIAYEATVSGLVPGSVHTYKLGWRAVGGTASCSYGGTDVGPVVMTVVALP